MQTDFDVTIIGAGVVGLAIAARIAKSGKKVLVLETNDGIGQITSSRNSGVIHAGIYYPQNSLKAQTCVEGKELLYDYVKRHKIPYKNLGKYIVSFASQIDRLQILMQKGIDNGVTDLKLFEKKELTKILPDVNADFAIFSPSTGIIDVHSFMLSLLGGLTDFGGQLALLSNFHSAKPLSNIDPAWQVEVECGKRGDKNNEKITISTNFLVNSAGLFAESNAKQIEAYPKKFIPKTTFVKGNYFSVMNGCNFNNLIYPLPESEGLGIHLTLDLSNQAILGPDTEPLEKKKLFNDENRLRFDYSVDEKQKEKFFSSVVKWWPQLKFDSIQPAYSGIRPKLKNYFGKTGDFIIQGYSQTKIPGLINLYGIESPGLTASLSLAELVAKEIAIYD